VFAATLVIGIAGVLLASPLFSERVGSTASSFTGTPNVPVNWVIARSPAIVKKGGRRMVRSYLFIGKDLV
jgi:hypothetical protein